jgi:hypothetical protein
VLIIPVETIEGGGNLAAVASSSIGSCVGSERQFILLLTLKLNWRCEKTRKPGARITKFTCNKIHALFFNNIFSKLPLLSLSLSYMILGVLF